MATIVIGPRQRHQREGTQVVAEYGHLPRRSTDVKNHRQLQIRVDNRPVMVVRRLTFTVDGRRVARQVSRLWAREFRVHVSRAGGSLDPRLVLACGIQEFAGLSSY
jgi:hypothetical protein